MGLLIYKYEPLWQEVSLKSHTRMTVKAFSSSTVIQIYEILGESNLTCTCIWWKLKFPCPSTREVYSKKGKNIELLSIFFSCRITTEWFFFNQILHKKDQCRLQRSIFFDQQHFGRKWIWVSPMTSQKDYTGVLQSANINKKLIEWSVWLDCITFKTIFDWLNREKIWGLVFTWLFCCGLC